MTLRSPGTAPPRSTRDRGRGRCAPGGLRFLITSFVYLPIVWDL
jgi:hypothetical protein